MTDSETIPNADQANVDETQGMDENGAEQIEAKSSLNPTSTSTSTSAVVYPSRLIAPMEFLRRKRYANAANDLVERFGLLPIYKSVLEPYIPNKIISNQQQQPQSNQAQQQPTASTPSAINPIQQSSSSNSPINFNPTTPNPFTPTATTLGAGPSTPASLTGAGVNAIQSPIPTTTTINDKKDPKLTMEKTYANYVLDLPGRVKPSKREIQSKEDQTVRNIVYRQETTLQPIKPLEKEAMQAAFTVQGGEVKSVSLQRTVGDGRR